MQSINVILQDGRVLSGTPVGVGNAAEHQLASLAVEDAFCLFEDGDPDVVEAVAWSDISAIIPTHL